MIIHYLLVAALWKEENSFLFCFSRDVTAAHGNFLGRKERKRNEGNTAPLCNVLPVGSVLCSHLDYLGAHLLVEMQSFCERI